MNMINCLTNYSVEGPAEINIVQLVENFQLLLYPQPELIPAVNMAMNLATISR
jgi:hypothetical protein